MLDLLAAVLDARQAQRGRGALEEVPEGGEGGEVVGLAVRGEGEVSLAALECLCGIGVV